MSFEKWKKPSFNNLAMKWYSTNRDGIFKIYNLYEYDTVGMHTPINT